MLVWKTMAMSIVMVELEPLLDESPMPPISISMLSMMIDVLMRCFFRE
jgi:hypothetical protein